MFEAMRRYADWTSGWGGNQSESAQRAETTPAASFTGRNRRVDRPACLDHPGGVVRRAGRSVRSRRQSQRFQRGRVEQHEPDNACKCNSQEEDGEELRHASACDRRI